MAAEDNKRNVVLVTGSTGYIGGLLVPRLIEAGYRVRCLVRDSARLREQPWHSAVEIVVGDVLQPDTMAPAMHGVRVAYYLVHSMGGGTDFHQRDLTAASNFGTAALAAGVERLIYLGGLAQDSPDLSEHLRSRQQTGDWLRKAGVPVTEFRAGVIVGSGSLSFEMIRYLTERVPVMICPRWVFTRTQPIGIQEVLEYLVAALSVPESSGRIIEIGGDEIVTYGEMMTKYAEARGLKRWMVSIPVLTPRLSSYWVNLVTPIPAQIARPLIEGLRNENVVRDTSAQLLFPQIQPVGYLVSVERALASLEADYFSTSRSTAANPRAIDTPAVRVSSREGMILEQRQRLVPTNPAQVVKIFMGMGGKRGWFYMNWVWMIRGLIDRMLGGAGLRPGRRDADELRVGDTLDFCRVEAVVPEQLLRLRVEMKTPGKTWLQFEVYPEEKEQTLFMLTVFFAPKGLLGWIYWYALYPLHRLVFNGLFDQIARRAVDLKAQ